MAKNTGEALAADTITQLTAADSANLAIMNTGGTTVWLFGAASASAPSNPAYSKAGAIMLEPGEAIKGALSDFWPGITAVRVYAYAHHPAKLNVSFSDAA